MADGTVGLLPDSTGKKVDTTELLNNEGVTVERQRVNIADPNDPNGFATVTNETLANPDNLYALLVRQIQEDNAYTQELLGQIANALALAVAPQVGGARGLNVLSNIASNFAVSLGSVAGITFNPGSVGTPGANTNSAPALTPRVPVVLDLGFPMPGVPQHIYGGITV